MANVHDVAAYILQKHGPMSAMRLQKLIYYAQAWSLVWEDRPLFNEIIEAWANGPVVPDLYEKHRGRYRIDAWPDGNPDALRHDDKDSIDIVLDAYGLKNAQQLSDLTHREEPWKSARGQQPPSQRGNCEITLESMMDYYGNLPEN